MICLIGAISYFAFLAFQGPLIEDDVIDDELGEVTAKGRCHVRLIVAVEFSDAFLQSDTVVELRQEGGLCSQNLLQLVPIVLALNGSDKFSPYFYVRLFEHVVKYISSNRDLSLIDGLFRTLLHECPVIVLGITQADSWFPFLVKLHLTVLSKLSGDDYFHKVTRFAWRHRTGLALHDTVFINHVIKVPICAFLVGTCHHHLFDGE